MLELKVDQYILAYNYGFWFQGSFAENFAFLLDSLKSGMFWTAFLQNKNYMPENVYGYIN